MALESQGVLFARASRAAGHESWRGRWGRRLISTYPHRIDLGRRRQLDFTWIGSAS
jgi:hypothetical protein